MTATPLTIDFRAGGNSAALVGAGWLDPDPRGRWSTGPEAELRLPLVPGRSYRLAIAATPFLAPGRPPPRLRLVAHGRVLAAVAAEGPLYLDLAVPPEALEPDGTLALRLQCPDAMPPTDDAEAPRLAVRLARVTVTPADDRAGAPELPAADAWRIPLDPAASPLPASALPGARTAPPRDDPPSVAALTLLPAPSVWLPFWLRHYARQVGRENCFVLTCGTEAAEAAGSSDVQIIRLPPAPDPAERAGLAARVRAALAARYDWVLFAAPDEIILADPLVAPSLPAYRRRPLPASLHAIGIEIQHLPAEEADLDPRLPATSQRAWVAATAAACVPALHESPPALADGTPAFDHLYAFRLRTADLRLGVAEAARAHPAAPRTPSRSYAAEFWRRAALPRVPGAALSPEAPPLHLFLGSAGPRADDGGALWPLPARFRGLF